MAIEDRLVTVSAPVNIAVIKYWGKRDAKLLLPVNSSLSGTLSQRHLRTTTSVLLSAAACQRDRLWLNGVEEDIQNPRLINVLTEIRRRAAAAAEAAADAPRAAALLSSRVHICSINNFPTAAGLASSASGYAALVFALAHVYGLPAVTEQDLVALSSIARVGSGSACRSLFGGFVKWEMGVAADGADSVAVPVAPSAHWPLHVLVLVASDQKKAVSSSSGMQNTVQTSDLLKARARDVLPQRMLDMERAIRERDFASFAEITMRDSNQFHAVCLDTYPPIFYLSDISRAVIHVITAFNAARIARGLPVGAAYTFDAGPNAVIYLPQENVREVLDLVLHYFPSNASASSSSSSASDSAYFSDPYGLFSKDEQRTGRVSDDVRALIRIAPQPAVLKYILHTEVGEGPQLLGDAEALLNHDGTPKVL